jgi:hypothetical protein
MTSTDFAVIPVRPAETVFTLAIPLFIIGIMPELPTKTSGKDRSAGG